MLCYREGSNLTPAHHYSDFRFKTYAPIAFRYFRELFGIQPDDFLVRLLMSDSEVLKAVPTLEGFTNQSNFHSFEDVCHGIEPLFQMTGNLLV